MCISEAFTQPATVLHLFLLRLSLVSAKISFLPFFILNTLPLFRLDPIPLQWNGFISVVNALWPTGACRLPYSCAKKNKKKKKQGKGWMFESRAGMRYKSRVKDHFRNKIITKEWSKWKKKMITSKLKIHFAKFRKRKTEVADVPTHSHYNKQQQLS